MRNKALAIVLCASFVGLGFGTPHQKIVDRTTASVIRITGETDVLTPFGPMHGTYSCTGFVIAVQRVLTAAHCLGTNMSADGQPVLVLKADPYYDLALLAVPTAKPALVLSNKPLERGDASTAIGYGFGFTQVTVVEGMVMLVDYQIPASDSGGESLPPLNFFQHPFIGGMSGGPVIDQSGKVIAMVQMSGEGVGLGVGTLIIRAFLLGTN